MSKYNCLFFIFRFFIHLCHSKVKSTADDDKLLSFYMFLQYLTHIFEFNFFSAFILIMLHVTQNEFKNSVSVNKIKIINLIMINTI